MEDDADTRTILSEDDDEYVSFVAWSDPAHEGWTMYTHPRGWVYFRNERHRVVSDEDLRVPASYVKAQRFCERYPSNTLPDEVEVHMFGVGPDPDFSLFVNHRQCVAGYDHEVVRTSAVKSLSMKNLLRYRTLYWDFVYGHPCHFPCPKQALAEAMDALNSYLIDHLRLGSHAIAPYSQSECMELLQILGQPHINATSPSPVIIALLGWMLKDAYSFRHASQHAQLSREDFRAHQASISKSPSFSPPQSLMTRAFLGFLIHGPFFGIPQTYFAHVKSANEFRGHFAGLRQNWETYTRQLVKEYSDFLLISTVLLSATVGLLAIEDINSPTRVAGVIAALTSLGSMTIGVFFVWRHQNNSRIPSSFMYLHNARSSAFGLSGHAILLSLPPVLLVWSIIAFTAGIVAYSLQNITSPGTHNDAPTWATVGIFLIILASVAISVYTFTTIFRWHSSLPWWNTLLSRQSPTSA